MRIERSLSDILKPLDDLPWDHQVYLKRGSLSDLMASVIVLNDEIERDDNDEPKYVTSRWVKYFLGVADLQDIKGNLSNQESQWSNEDLIYVICYYHANYTFATIGS